MHEKTKHPAKTTTENKVSDDEGLLSVPLEPIENVLKDNKKEKHKKPKMVRDSFTMPDSDYAHIARLKERCLKSGVSVKKSEILRAALKCLSKLPDDSLKEEIAGLDIIKTGRPSKN